MYGLPDSAALSQVVYELTATHPRTVGEHTGQEPALLALLEVAIKSDTSGAYGGGASRTGAPVDTAALHLWGEISRCIGEHWPGRGDLARAKTPVIRRLELWTEALVGTDHEGYLLEMCSWWHTQIRDMLEPPKRVPLRGVQCVRCKADQVLGTNPDGERVYVPTLLAHISETPARVECLCCGGTWYEGSDLTNLAATMEFST